MTDQHVRDGLRGFVELVPVHPNLAAVLAPRPRRPRRAWLVPALAAAAVLAVLTPVVALPDAPPPPRPADGGITLPRQFPAHSTSIPLLADAPTGPAIAFYRQSVGHVDFDHGEAYVAGATADTYRRLGIKEESGARLSPDGTRLALGDCSGKNPVVTLVDLATDARRTLRLDPPRVKASQGWSTVTAPRAWSPDGRYLVVSTYADTFCNIPVISGPLWLLDTETGSYHQLAADQKPSPNRPTLVAFAPDGKRIAVQLDTRLTIMDLDGRTIRELDVPPGQEIAGAQAWSPDGTLLVLITQQGRILPDPNSPPMIAFLDATGTAATVPAPVHAGFVIPAWRNPVLGWKDPGTFLVLVSLTGKDYASAEADNPRILQFHVTGGGAEVLATLRPGPDRSVAATDVQLAVALVPAMGTRAGPPAATRPRPRWLTPAIVAGALTLLAGGWLIVRRIRTRRP
ncbi:hypothetical protein Lfu02_02940 [Longispora fulva]|uniref:WD40 repeat protein n=1 Tax=Longispora fulva TaxID=619741 RepID=A0A8J7GC45_9ACTN|nr:hypothetical protein [Longispora fulva]MBG6135834.1 hypothetical protein [Longispora fulva]GIG55922.1 hypothetical protein Lfu02_02940 [Longispora fulva]